MMRAALVRALVGCTLAAPIRAVAQTDAGRLEPAAPLAMARGAALEVPFVPQSPALCGGAAVAMVLRYWGERGIHAEEFAALVGESGEGIRTIDLTNAVRQRGWRAAPLTGSRALMRSHLERGWPVIALIEVRPRRYHYVVVVGWDDGRVILHDPARGPLRTVSEAAFERAWQASAHWAMLVLPAPAARMGASGQAGNDPTASTSVADDIVLNQAAIARNDYTNACSALLAAAADAARSDDFTTAEHALAEAARACPDRAAVMIEQAGLRFRQRLFADASEVAARALSIRPDDAYGWDLLASSLYMRKEFEAALAAWNRSGRPRNDLVRIDGLARTRYRVVHDAIGIAPATMVTPNALSRARRRIAALPTATLTRVDYRPVRGGDVEIHAAIVERPPLPLSTPDLLAHALRAAADYRVEVGLASVFEAGELWQLGWSWQRNRRALGWGLAVPGAFGVPGIWELRLDDRTYSYRSGVNVYREVRRTASLSLKDWTSGAAGWGVTASIDTWPGHASFAALGAELEIRAGQDRIALRIAAAGARSLEAVAMQTTDSAAAGWSAPSGAAFHRVQVQAAARSAGENAAREWTAHAGMYWSSRNAPPSVWYGAGSGRGADALLRAHPLLDGNGGVTSAFFGPQLVHATGELRQWLHQFGPVRIGLAAFVDAARVRPAARTGPSRNAVDAGVGLRIRVPGLRGTVRVDVAGGITDGRTAMSFGVLPRRTMFQNPE